MLLQDPLSTTAAHGEDQVNESWLHAALTGKHFPPATITSFLLFSVLDDAGCVDEGDPLQQLVGHLDTHQPLQEALAELLQGGEGPRAVRSHDDALDGPELLAVHYDGVLGGGGLSTWWKDEEGMTSDDLCLDIIHNKW